MVDWKLESHRNRTNMTTRQTMCGMIMSRKNRLKGVSSYKDRHGKLRWRFRRRSFSCMLPDPESPDFGKAYDAARRCAQNGRRPDKLAHNTHGTIRALFAAYLSSKDFSQLKESTRRPRRKIIDNFVSRFGHLPAAQMKTAHVQKVIREKLDTPAAANELLKVIRVVFDFGVSEGSVPLNPARGVNKLKSRSPGHHTWSDDEIQIFRNAYASGTKERLAFELFLQTGQRVSDVSRLGWQDISDGCLLVRQQKTGTLVHIPILLELQIELDQICHGHLVFLVSSRGAPYTTKSLSQWFVKRAQQGGLPQGRSPHGLRKAAARRLAEAGCSPHEIASITGHRSLSEVTRYSREADLKKLSLSAAKKLRASMNREQKLANRQAELAKKFHNPRKGIEK